MSVSVVARIRPLLRAELDKDTIVTVDPPSEPSKQPNVVRIPNPKNENEAYSFHFNSVYPQETSQQEFFNNEVAPTIKHLFNGFDVTLFAYGVTGTGKTHTMRGGKSMADRGVIPRLLSGIYRRARKIEKDANGEASVEVTMSYYEIYNDKVFDLFEAPEKRTAAGLPLRDNGGKTVVVGLTERPCETLKEFEAQYDQANVNRSTSATKLNAHSSRSHAILCVKVSVTAGEKVVVSTASAIDLAGSEDNRRTDNGKERLVESASINKSLFVLAQCVEAIGKKQPRVPYRESKMTRILSLGQNNGLTIMILNLAPIRSYHLDTLSSLNFANRTKKIEVREVENEPVFKGCSRPVPIAGGLSIKRQPLRPLALTVHNPTVRPGDEQSKPGDKPAKAFAVWADKSRSNQPNNSASSRRTDGPKRSSPLKRPSEAFSVIASRPSKYARQSPHSLQRSQLNISQAAIEGMIEKKVSEIFAARALEQPAVASSTGISEEVKRRLELLEEKIEGKDDGRAEGLTFLLMAKQHHVRGEDASALKMYELAKDYFPDNRKLENKISKLRHKLTEKRSSEQSSKDNSDGVPRVTQASTRSLALQPLHKAPDDPNGDGNYNGTSDEDFDYESDDGFRYRSKPKKAPRAKALNMEHTTDLAAQTPRTKQLLDIINTRDISQIRMLKGVGVKRAEAIVEALCAGEDETEAPGAVDSLGQLGRLKGVGVKTVENMRAGLVA